MAGRPVRTYVEGTPPLPAGLGGVPVVEGPQTQEYGELWYYYLAGQFQTYEPPVPIDAPPEAPTTSAPRPPDLQGPPPSASPPLPTPQSELPRTPVAEVTSSPPAPVAPEAPLPLGPPDQPNIESTVPPDSLAALGVAAGGSYRAAQEAERAARIAELEAAAELERLLDKEKLAQEAAERALTQGTVESADDRAMREAFEGIGKKAATPASVEQVAELGRLSQVARAGARVLGRVAGAADALGPLGVMLPPIFMPDDRAAEGAANIDRELGERRARERRLERERRRSIPAGKRSREPAARPPAPPPPPEVPHLPGLDPDELADVLGERTSTTTPSRKSSPSSPSPSPSRRSGSLSGPAGSRAEPRWWETVLEDAAQAGWDVIYRRYGPQKRRRTQPTASARTARRSEPRGEPFGEPEPVAKRETGTRRPRPEPRPEPDASALPRALTAVTSAVLESPPDNCRCVTRRRPKRPSSKVPQVRSYTRRMSQNSLDNLKRGP